MHLLAGGRLKMRKSVFLPDADKSETIELPVASALIRHRQGNVLFDTGCHPKAAVDAAGCWGALAKFMTPIMPADENVLTGLAALGLAPTDIDVVVNSHLHTDHCGCNAFFPRATFVAHALEIEAARAAEGEMSGYIRSDWEGARKLDAISAERDLFGDSRVVLVHLPGHTPGSIAALVGLERSGRMLLAGDTVSLMETLERDVIPRNTWDKHKLAGSLDEVRRIAGSGVTVIASHDAAQWSRLRKGAEAYD
jgi:glyoxylase-like metal-dependent hydrolase (beta-lactamase superfamily II)